MLCSYLSLPIPEVLRVLGTRLATSWVVLSIFTSHLILVGRSAGWPAVVSSKVKPLQLTTPARKPVHHSKHEEVVRACYMHMQEAVYFPGVHKASCLHHASQRLALQACHFGHNSSWSHELEHISPSNTACCCCEMRAACLNAVL